MSVPARCVESAVLRRATPAYRFQIEMCNKPPGRPEHTSCGHCSLETYLRLPPVGRTGPNLPGGDPGACNEHTVHVTRRSTTTYARGTSSCHAARCMQKREGGADRTVMCTCTERHRRCDVVCLCVVEWLLCNATCQLRTADRTQALVSHIIH